MLHFTWNNISIVTVFLIMRYNLYMTIETLLFTVYMKAACKPPASHWKLSLLFAGACSNIEYRSELYIMYDYIFTLFSFLAFWGKMINYFTQQASLKIRPIPEISSFQYRRVASHLGKPILLQYFQPRSYFCQNTFLSNRYGYTNI